MAGIDKYTLLMLPGNNFVDLSPLKKTVSSKGATAANSETHFPGCQSFYFDGSNQPILADPSDFSSGDFTLDWWEYCETDARTRFCSVYNDAYGGIMVGWDLNKMLISSIVSSWNVMGATQVIQPQYGVWEHIAVVRNSQSLTVYQNGNSTWSGTLTSPIYYDPSSSWSIGASRPSEPQNFKGYIQEFRVSNIARWTSNFEPPTEPYSPDVLPPIVFAPSSVFIEKQFVVDWSTVSSAITYTLEQQINGGSWSQVYTGSGTSYQATAVGTSMAFRVLATDENGNESDYSAVQNVKIFPSISGTLFGGVVSNG